MSEGHSHGIIVTIVHIYCDNTCWKTDTLCIRQYRSMRFAHHLIAFFIYAGMPRPIVLWHFLNELNSTVLYLIQRTHIPAIFYIMIQIGFECTWITESCLPLSRSTLVRVHCYVLPSVGSASKPRIQTCVITCAAYDHVSHIFKAVLQKTWLSPEEQLNDMQANSGGVTEESCAVRYKLTNGCHKK